MGKIKWIENERILNNYYRVQVKYRLKVILASLSNKTFDM